MLILPTEKNKPKVQNPRFLILFGKPKAGKTTLLSMLEGCLIIDLEGGSEFLEALSIQARSVNDLAEIANQIRQKITQTGTKPYKYIAIDNATRLEEICLPYAATLYRQTPMGKTYKGNDVRQLPNGSGYLYFLSLLAISLRASKSLIYCIASPYLCKASVLAEASATANSIKDLFF